MNNRERGHSDKFFQWREKALKGIKRSYVRANTPDPLEAAKAKLKSETDNLELMKAANKIIRSKKSEVEKVEALGEIGISETLAIELMMPGRFGGMGFASFQLTNCRNRIKNTQARVNELERRATAEDVEIEREDGISIVHNQEANRLQVFFPDKPEYETRTRLKRNGFRWSPSNGCWQAYLNPNSIAKLDRVLAS